MMKTPTNYFSARLDLLCGVRKNLAQQYAREEKLAKEIEPH